MKTLLSKVTDLDVVERAIARKQKITEEDLHVADLDLSASEMLLVKEECIVFLDTCAMESLEANYEALRIKMGSSFPSIVMKLRDFGCFILR